MDLMQSLLRALLSTGATWVLWVLVALSVVSIGLILERLHFYHRTEVDLPQLTEALTVNLEFGDLERAKSLLGSKPGIEAGVAFAGLRAAEKGPDSAAEAMASARAVQRKLLEDHLSVLGTLGNNAPFVGLFGTVIGIIKAFHDLSLDTSGAARAVMAGISEALVATAMGLFVAIPAVVAFNYFQRRVRARVSATDALSHMVLAELKRRPKPAPPPAAAAEVAS